MSMGLYTSHCNMSEPTHLSTVNSPFVPLRLSRANNPLGLFFSLIFFSISHSALLSLFISFSIYLTVSISSHYLSLSHLSLHHYLPCPAGPISPVSLVWLSVDLYRRDSCLYWSCLGWWWYYCCGVQLVTLDTGVQQCSAVYTPSR